MKSVFTAILGAFISALFLCATATASRIPSTNLAIELKTDETAYPEQNKMILSAFEKEMRLKGFMGRIRLLETDNPSPVSGETLIKIAITKNGWNTRKLLSIPYLLNRYKREFTLETYVEIPEGRNGSSIKRMKAVSSTSALAQYNYNDKFDPGLYPSQSERLEMEEEARRLLARKLAGHLFSQLK